ncbi:hypothetical protein NMY22_g3486 [Coprinellus aureogranulatus]|nr:hypothetical protein NMY22_g3486 [Coprinellus aureogranulatus]
MAKKSKQAAASSTGIKPSDVPSVQNRKPLIEIPEDEQRRLIEESGILNQFREAARNEKGAKLVEEVVEERIPLADEIFNAVLYIIPMSFLLLMMEMYVLRVNALPPLTKNGQSHPPAISSASEFASNYGSNDPWGPYCVAASVLHLALQALPHDATTTIRRFVPHFHETDIPNQSGELQDEHEAGSTAGYPLDIYYRAVGFGALGTQLGYHRELRLVEGTQALLLIRGAATPTAWQIVNSDICPAICVVFNWDGTLYRQSRDVTLEHRIPPSLHRSRYTQNFLGEYNLCAPEMSVASLRDPPSGSSIELEVVEGTCGQYQPCAALASRRMLCRHDHPEQRMYFGFEPGFGKSTEKESSIGKNNRAKRHVRQQVVVSGLHGDALAGVVDDLERIYVSGAGYFQEGSLAHWTPGLQNGDLSLDAYSRYFTHCSTVNMSHPSSVPFEPGIGDETLLRKFMGNDFLYTEDNRVEYLEGVRDSEGVLSFRKVSPVAFKLGDIVEVTIAVNFIPTAQGTWKMLTVLRSVALIDHTQRDAAAILRMRSRYKNRPTVGPQGFGNRRRSLYDEEAVESANERMKKMRLD